jgi:hypothetical protein
MQEAVVLQHVATHIVSQGYRVWHNPRGLECIDMPIHQVAVAGRHRDLLSVGEGSILKDLQGGAVDSSGSRKSVPPNCLYTLST